ncbi:ParB/RepB/Spo0J family partition protein [Candidatus Uhrbacteria bacterium]|nr:MAG: ParB/RepB/Spo0J family partition protein [Candidatus Uhrbacteria bacterium]
MILQRQSGLGRGLGAIIPQKPAPSASVERSAKSVEPEASDATRNALRDAQVGQRVIDIPIASIERNPHQPRVHFDHGDLEDLISSIREHGVLQPIIVTPKSDGTYQLIAGERRLRASTIAGLKTIPALVREATELQKLELAIIENVQRADLNPVEEAKAYMRLMDEFGMTQEDIGRKIGKSRPQVANIVRLLQLPDEIQQALVEGKISASNARTLLSLPTDKERIDLFRAMLAGHFTVRQTETQVSVRKRIPGTKDPNIAEAESRLREALKTKVSINRSARGTGDIKIRFDSDEELQTLIQRITSNE